MADMITYPETELIHTIKEYEALPDDRRVEVIRGEVYDMAAPSQQHQDIVRDLSYEIETYLRKKGGKCSRRGSGA